MWYQLFWGLAPGQTSPSSASLVRVVSAKPVARVTWFNKGKRKQVFIDHSGIDLKEEGDDKVMGPAQRSVARGRVVASRWEGRAERPTSPGCLELTPWTRQCFRKALVKTLVDQDVSVWGTRTFNPSEFRSSFSLILVCFFYLINARSVNANTFLL